MDNERHTEVLLMAAGGSSRFGRPKQLVPFRDMPLVRYLAQQALGAEVSAVRVILGADRTRVGNELRGLRVDLVVNDAWRSGLSSSIGAGLRALRPGTESVIIMLCDMPLVTTGHLNALIAERNRSGKGIVASRYEDRPGVPALFTQTYVPGLLRLRGDTGAKALLLEHPADTALVELAGAGVDIDTQEDLKRIA